MPDTPPSIARSQKRLHQKLHEGAVVSFTTLAHRTIGLILLDDGSQVLAPIMSDLPSIGQRVIPRMRLHQVTMEGLRSYGVSYEACAQIGQLPAFYISDAIHVFPGYILALTGPSGVGKSTISRMLHRVFRDHTIPVPILTTREPKEGDENEYHYISPVEFHNLRDAGQIIASARIPSRTEERWYGYRAPDIEAIWEQGKLPIVITEKHLLQGLSDHYGRRSILSFGLLPPGRSKRAMLSHLLHRLRTRGRDTEEHIRDRMANAEKDLAFFTNRRDLFDHIVVNDDLSSVITRVRDVLPRSF